MLAIVHKLTMSDGKVVEKGSFIHSDNDITYDEHFSKAKIMDEDTNLLRSHRFEPSPFLQDDPKSDSKSDHFDSTVDKLMSNARSIYSEAKGRVYSLLSIFNASYNNLDDVTKSIGDSKRELYKAFSYKMVLDHSFRRQYVFYDITDLKLCENSHEQILEGKNKLASGVVSGIYEDISDYGFCSVAYTMLNQFSFTGFSAKDIHAVNYEITKFLDENDRYIRIHRFYYVGNDN